jgi:hypothetical protein
MTHEQEKAQHLENNLRRLFDRLAEEGDMASAVRAAILERLQEEASVARRPPRVRSFGRGWRRWASAAAGLLVAAGFILWSTVGNVTWAAVVHHISQASTLVALTRTERLDGSQKRVIARTRLYYKDPGMSRMERFENPHENLSRDPDRVDVLVRAERSATKMRLFPAERRGERKVYTFAEGAASRVTLNMVAEAWTRLSDTAQSTARPLGERRIDGIRAVGFEVPAEALFGKASAGTSRHTVQLWAARRTGVPVALVLETRTERTTVDQMRWNEPLSDDLFDVAGPSGWTVEDLRIEVPATGLPAEARFVSFAVHLLAGTPGGDAGNAESAGGAIDTARLLPKRYLSNADVETASVVHDGTSCSVSIQMTAEGTEKLARLTRGHIGERLALVIDGKVEMAPTIRSEITQGQVMVTGAFSEDDCRKIASGLIGEQQ